MIRYIDSVNIMLDFGVEKLGIFLVFLAEPLGFRVVSFTFAVYLSFIRYNVAYLLF